MLDDIDPTPDVPLPSNINSPISGVQVIHHNVQGLLLKISESSLWLRVIMMSMLLFAVVRPG